MKERLIHIDNAKAIGMMLIIASHIIPSEPFVKSYGYEIWNSILNSFYVPLFFLLSGVFESTAVNDEKLYQRIVKLAKYICLFYVFGIVVVSFIQVPDYDMVFDSFVMDNYYRGNSKACQVAQLFICVCRFGGGNTFV